MSNSSPFKPRKIYTRTPLIESIPLRAYTANRPIYLKLENTQPSGSFKMRGISVLCEHAKTAGYTTMVCASSGNAGLATALSCRALGLVCHIVVFKATPESVREKIRSYGATVEEVGVVWDESFAYAVKMTSNSKEKFLVHPFNHPILWSGHSTMVDEIAEDLGPDVVTCCGGGGLTCGLIEGIRAQKSWTQKTKILVMETIGAESFYICVQAGGAKMKLESTTSIASSLVTEEVCDQIVADWRANKPPLLSRVVSDRDVVQACLAFANDHRMIVGTACGAALAAVYGGIVERLLEEREDFEVKMYDKEEVGENSDGPIVVVVCGGAEVTFDSLGELKGRFNL